MPRADSLVTSGGVRPPRNGAHGPVTEPGRSRGPARQSRPDGTREGVLVGLVKAVLAAPMRAGNPLFFKGLGSAGPGTCRQRETGTRDARGMTGGGTQLSAHDPSAEF